jgi:hypothetical protein
LPKIKKNYLSPTLSFGEGANILNLFPLGEAGRGGQKKSPSLSEGD